MCYQPKTVIWDNKAMMSYGLCAGALEFRSKVANRASVHTFDRCGIVDQQKLRRFVL